MPAKQKPKEKGSRMKTISSLIILLLGTVVAATAQSNFRASLAPTEPENSWIPASAAFSLDGPSASFTISLGYELSGAAPPTTARLGGTNAEFTFELVTPSIVVHFPLPWPSEPWPFDYGPSTSFGGSFLLPDNLREDFIAGRTTLLLLGGQVGDFSGAVLPVSPPLIKGLDRQGSSFGIHFTAEPPYQYTVEYTESLRVTNWSELGKVGAASRTFEAVVTDSVTNGAARFYRIRRELCCH
jgi:hypothetical protein